MKKLTIKEKSDFIYTLVDDDNNAFKIRIEFHNVFPSIGDVIFISEDVLKEQYLLAFGSAEEKGDSKDYIKLIHNSNELYLQRYYG